MDAAYDVRGGGWLETVSFDLRYALRRLWHVPGCTIPAVLILVFGIGANTVLFTVLSAALFSRPPVPAPDEIVRVYVGKSVAFPTYARSRKPAEESWIWRRTHSGPSVSG